MRVLCLPASGDASANLRMAWPGLLLAEAGHDVKVAGLDFTLGAITDDATGAVKAVARPDCDVLVFQRLRNAAMVAAIPLLQAHGVAVVVDMDDDFGSIPPANQAWAATHPRLSPTANFHHLALACRLADMVTVTTPRLAQLYGAHGRVAVIPNRLPRQVTSVVHEEGDPLRVGWPGNVAVHPDDLYVPGLAVSRVCSENGLLFVNVGPGGCGAPLDLSPATAERTTGFVPGRQWYAAIAESIDVGIVPLALTRFGQCKSGLKLLELSSCGVPAVASPTEDNQRLNRLGMGVLASKPKEWYRELRRMVTDAGWRAEVARRSWEAAKGEALEDHLEGWWKAWNRALEFRKKRAEDVSVLT